MGRVPYHPKLTLEHRLKAKQGGAGLSVYHGTHGGGFFGNLLKSGISGVKSVLPQVAIAAQHALNSGKEKQGSLKEKMQAAAQGGIDHLKSQAREKIQRPNF